MNEQPPRLDWQPEHDNPQVVQSLMRLQALVLERITRNAPLQQVLDLLCREAESRIADAVVSVMILDDEGRLNLAAAPSLPKEAWPMLTDIQPCETAGSCGNAIHRGEPVFVCNVPSDRRWDGLRALAEQYAVGACWSYPVFLQSDRPQATFAITSFRKREPAEEDDLLLRVGAHLVGVALSFSRQHVLLQQMGAAMQSTSEGVCFFDGQRRVFMSNAAFRAMSGRGEAELRHLDLRALLPPEQWQQIRAPLLAALEQQGAWRGELDLLQPAGDRLPVIVSLNRMHNPATGETEYVALVTDIRQQKAHARRLEHLLEHDGLTGLLNRRGLEKRIKSLMTEAQNRRLGLVCVDLDRFKNINDTFGHKIGDQVLQGMARRLRRAWPELALARQGGDQYLLLFEDVEPLSRLNEYMDGLLRLFREPVSAGAGEFLFTATAGVAVYPDDADSVEELLSCADTALHEAKQRGQDHWLPYTRELSHRRARTLDIEHALRRELMEDDGAFRVVYQLQCDQDGQPFGIEALVRWHSPALGPVMPGEFIPLAEETGLIRQLGHVVLRRACAEFMQLPSHWRERLRLAVNLSRVQLCSDLVLTVADILQQTGLEPGRMELEITETADTMASRAQQDVLLGLRKLGVHLALDDFGTGYSSLTELKHLPVNVLKIDQTLTRDILDDPSDAALVRAALALGDALDLTVVAEGVETEAQLGVLKQLGCTRFQGYYFCKPVELAQLREKLEHGS